MEASPQAYFDQLGNASQVFALFDLLPDVSFFVKDRQGRYVWLNPLGCEFCRVRSSRDAFGKTDRDFFPESRAAKYVADDEAVMRSGQPIVNRLEPAPEGEGSPHLVVTSKLPLRDATGAVVGVVGFSRRVESLSCLPFAWPKLARAVEILHRNFADPLRTQSLAKTVGLSVSQFERAFRKTFQSTPRQYLLRIRVEHACRRLAETGATLAEVAQACGFYDQAHFARAFQELMGVKPSVYRRQAQQPAVCPVPAEVLKAVSAARRSAKTKGPRCSFQAGDSQGGSSVQKKTGADFSAGF